jgi:voltage-gated potassium channel
MRDGVREPVDHKETLKAERWELLRHVDEVTAKPMIVLSFVWLVLLVVDFTSGLSRTLEVVSYVIWGLFVVDFAIEFTIAPRKVEYLKKNWLTAVALLLPALRVFAAFRIFRAARALRAARGVRLVRWVTSINRGMRAVRASLARRGIGYVFALTLLVVVAGAAGMYQFERPESLAEAGYAAEGGLTSYGDAVWWTAMLMTTVGSEYWPKTAEGRILCFVLSLYAFGVFGYFTATIASFFVGQEQAAKK